MNIDCNSMLLPPYIPKLRRVYHALCSCGNITFVNNNKRVGGMCIPCRRWIKALVTIRLARMRYKNRNSIQ